MNFGDNLRTLRKSSKMSQEVLAEKVGVSRQSISKWEVGAAYPEMTNIMALCTIFHCNINDLINEDIVDSDAFNEEVKENIVKFKNEQQKNMKKISKAIFITSNVCKFVVAIPTVIVILVAIIFPFISRWFKIDDDKIVFFNKEIDYSIDRNILHINGEDHFIESQTNIKEFVKEHDNTFFIISIEYVLICIIIMCMLSVLVLHYLYKLYKKIYNEDTPFTLENEKIVKKIVLFFLIQMVFTKISAFLYSIVANLDLALELNIKDVIILLIAISVVYLFKYGRMIQSDSKAKIYGKYEE